MTDLSQLPPPQPVEPQPIKDYCIKEIARLNTSIRLYVSEKETVRRRKSPGYTKRLAQLDRSHYASVGRRVVLIEILDMLKKGKLA